MYRRTTSRNWPDGSTWPLGRAILHPSLARPPSTPNSHVLFSCPFGGIEFSHSSLSDGGVTRIDSSRIDRARGPVQEKLFAALRAGGTSSTAGARRVRDGQKVAKVGFFGRVQTTSLRWFASPCPADGRVTGTGTMPPGICNDRTSKLSPEVRASGPLGLYGLTGPKPTGR